MRRAMLILTALLLAAPAVARDPRDASRYARCLATAGSEPVVAIVEATRWRGAGGGVPARHCLALAYLAQKQFASAARELGGAARDAEATRDPLTAELWGQAGVAALAGGDAATANNFLTSGIAAAPGNAARAALLTDRARALVELKRLPEARTDLDAATRLDPEGADAWLLSSTLARRQGDLKVAEASLIQAARRAPDDADVQLEAGNIAAAQGRTDLARAAWTAAIAAAPGSPAAAAARAALSAGSASLP
jgi:tetratricopeptide (TPR) repeat protein